MSKVIRVLIVDDSKIIQKILINILSQDSRIEVIDTADNGLQAYKKILLLKPDLVTLDVNMPVMNGLDLLYTMRKENIFTRVLLISTLTQSGNTLTLAALDLGAIDFIQKPSVDSINSIANEIIHKVVDIGNADVNKYIPFPKGINLSEKVTKKEIYKTDTKENDIDSKNACNAIKSLKGRAFANPRLVAVGVSTGGPRALRILLPAIDKNFPLPILISQHIPVEFTKSLVSSLSGICELNVKEALDNEIIKKGNVYITPGNRHIAVYRNENNELVIKLDSSTKHRYSPSVNHMFSSISKNIDGRAIAVIMTGMGNDGTDGLKELKKNDTLVIAQDEKSSTIFGMPRSAIENNLTTLTLPLEDIAYFLNKYAKGIDE